MYILYGVCPEGDIGTPEEHDITAALSKVKLMSMNILTLVFLYHCLYDLGHMSVRDSTSLR